MTPADRDQGVFNDMWEGPLDPVIVTDWDDPISVRLLFHGVGNGS
jgi:hypothetical protein